MTLTPEKSTAAPAAREDLVTVSIDGFEVGVPKGTLIIRAAEQIGVQIPRFCDHPLLDPVGACRQCLVEVPDMGNGRAMPKPPAACTTTVMPGMVIKTQLTSHIAEKAQAGNMELLLINHPLDCPICDKGGECPLQNQSMSSGAAESRFIDTKRTYPKPIAISSQVLLDRERCVLCARCTRFSQQIAGDPFIELFERGALEQVGTVTDEPFQSYFSGNTVQICPVGALTGASYRFRSRPFDLVSTPGVCEHCASGCAQRTDWRRGTVLRRLAGNDPAVNEEWNCDKGRWAFTYASATDRILSPLVRNAAGELKQTSWPEALQRVAEGLTEGLAAGGIGVLPGGRVTYEDAYAYAKFARIALATNDIDMRARPHSREELDFLAAHVVGSAPGTGGLTYADLDVAKTVLLVGFEPEEESPIVFLRLRKAFLAHGLQVFSVAPLRTRGAHKMGATLLPAVPGGEAEVLDAIRAGAQDVLPASEGMRGDNAVILVGERLASVPGALSAASALAEETGARLAWVPRRAGERGAVDAGCLPTLLPGGRGVTDAAARAELEQAWGVRLPEHDGRDLTGMLTAVRGGELAGLVVGGVDMLDVPDPVLAEAALRAARFVVSLELRDSTVTAYADVVLPVAPAVHKAGTYLDWEGRARPYEETVRSVGAMTDARVLGAIAAQLGVDLGTDTTQGVRAELAGLPSTAAERPAAPRVPPARVAVPKFGQAALATWHHLLDLGSLQDCEEHLAGTARVARIHLSAATAREIAVREGGEVTVRTEQGSITLPLAIADMPDRVVWLPTNSLGSQVRRDLGAEHGSLVQLTGGTP